MQGDAKRVVGVNILSQSIDWVILNVFRLEGSKQAVPDDQSPAVVTVDIPRIRAVMYAMM